MASNFSAKYTNANLAQNASLYESDIFASWRSRLDAVLGSSSPSLSSAIIAVILCAQRRGDAVGPFFGDSIEHGSEVNNRKVFALIREALLVAFPFVGLPNCMPAAFGLISELRKRNIEPVPEEPRPDVKEVDYYAKGLDTSEKIYHGVGNNDVRVMMNSYFPTFSYISGVAVFGYILGGGDILPLTEIECLVFAAVVATGATRQAQSHCKAALQLGNDEKALQTIVDVANELASWNRSPLPAIVDVAQLQVELDGVLAVEGI